MQSQKDRLVRELAERGFLKSKKVIEAFRKVPRENFMPKKYISEAYGNYPLPIGFG